MAFHTEEQFNTFLEQLYETNATLKFLTDFAKVKNKVAAIEIKLNTLNYLLGKQDLHSAVANLWNTNKDVFDVLPILVACRKTDKKKVINSYGEIVLLDRYFDSIEGIIEFLEQTGLADVFRHENIKNLVDYVLGVEVGLDTNARKNRSGHAMENAVEQIIKASGVKYRKEITSIEWPAITEALGTDKKRFDFVIEAKDETYLVEVNFYSGGGSKLNETARSFADIATKINAVKDFYFVWVTDGKGWKSAKNKLQEAYYSIPHTYNLYTFRNFLEHINKDA